MKNFAFLVVALLMSGAMYGQILEESFSSNTAPEGWKFDHKSRMSNWKFGYNGVMPHSGPTVESEFTTGAALFNNGEGRSKRGKAIILSPKVDLSTFESAHLEITYNLQVSEEQGEFVVEIFDGKKWKEVYSQTTASPKNTGMNELVLLDVAELANEEFQVKFVFDDKGKESGHSLAIDHFKLTETSIDNVRPQTEIGAIDFRHLDRSVLVLDANASLLDDSLNNLGEHLSQYELTTDSTLYRNLNELTAQRRHFRMREENNVGSFKVLTK